MVVGDGEGHQLVQGQFALGVEGEQPVGYGCQLEALANDGRRDEEARRDCLVALTLFAQGLEGTKLVERMQRLTLTVFGERILLGRDVRALSDDTGHGCCPRQALLFHEPFERTIAPTSGRHFEHAGFIAFGIDDRADVEALEQGPSCNVLGKIFDRDAGLDPAHIGLAQHELVEGDVPRGGQDDFLGSLGHGMFSVTGGREPLSRP
jgi:hypothetical protein